ncbi:4Fe-4S dicluster domain-containing protein [Amphritea balenae]|uniref:Sulfite reductase subunit A n=1 Tax=Amphritea balenae TaxID=452629 RepID=A0A3P1SMV2_9GAMM|nr:4Fe-4S dicluster domain-containing protein [Amphritea balenae]RRC98581.1 sulfite reductase subunit A [Amphritea balenae]GGK65698.1 cytochrome c [Amphritea balenae]
MYGSETGFLARESLPELFSLLHVQGFDIVAPQIQDGSILYQVITGAEQLPSGWQDQQQPGSYRLTQTESPLNFSWANGPQALKPWLFAPREVIWRAEKQPDGRLQFCEPDAPDRKLAVLGVRSCDLAALKLQDAHFLNNRYHDPYYAARRKGLLIIAVNCSHPADTCFCVSTGDGPHAEQGFDLCLTELENGFLISSGSETGNDLYEKLPLTKATEKQLHNQLQQKLSASKQQRALPQIPVKQLLSERRDHPRWDDIAERCLACGNCTQVCPTCFCHKEGDLASLDASTSEHLREWDSCFSEGHGYMAGHQARPEIKDRYQQWMIHKLSSWHDQYGRSGCTGCGRCTTWCPAAIDFVEEVNLICGDES